MSRSIPVSFLSVICLFLFVSCQFNSIDDPSQRVQEVANTIHGMKYTSYEMVMEVDQMGVNRKDTFNCLLENTDGQVSKYRFISDAGNHFYDGQKLSMEIPDERVLVVSNNPSRQEALANMNLLVSPIFIADLCELAISDSLFVLSNAKDTIINNEKYLDIIIKSKGALLLPGNGVVRDPALNKTYQLIVRADNLHPVMFKDLLGEGDFLAARYISFKKRESADTQEFNFKNTDIKYNEMSLSDYYMAKYAALQANQGAIAKDFDLKRLNTPGNLSLYDQLKTGEVLLMFWFPNCGGCIEATTWMNENKGVFSEQGVTPWAVEFTEMKTERLSSYLTKHPIDFDVLFGNKQLALEFGVYSAPTFVLINKDREMVYFSSGLNKSSLLSAVESL